MSDRVLDIDDLARDLDAVGDALESGSFQEILRGPIRGVVLAAVGENFASSRGPDGEAWPARQKIGDGHPLLIESGALMGGATGQGAGHTTEADDRELTVAVELVHAATHEYGRPGANIPARPYMGVADSKFETVDAMIAKQGETLIDAR